MTDNLPNNPNLIQDPSSVTSLFSPSPEVPAVSTYEVSPNVEKTETLLNEAGMESQPSSEVPVPVPAVEKDSNIKAIPVTDEPETLPKNVVDETTHIVASHKIETSHKVTEEADEEEEDFITHVEEVHSIV